MGSDFVVIGTKRDAAECQCADLRRKAAELHAENDSIIEYNTAIESANADLRKHIEQLECAANLNQAQNIRLVARINKQSAAIGAMLPALRLIMNELGGKFQPYDSDSFLPDHILCQIAPAIAAGEAAL